eukprot:6178602-Pleurochrysis_carterae.AAC.1
MEIWKRSQNGCEETIVDSFSEFCLPEHLIQVESHGDEATALAIAKAVARVAHALMRAEVGKVK